MWPESQYPQSPFSELMYQVLPADNWIDDDPVVSRNTTAYYQNLGDCGASGGE